MRSEEPHQTTHNTGGAIMGNDPKTGLPANMHVISLRTTRGFHSSSPESKALIAKQLDEQQIAAVAAYYQEVRSSNSVATTK
jgi:cytochrome c553